MHDLFATNTYWALRTDSARAQPLGDDRWRVTLDVRASKAVVDTAGVETDVPMNDVVEIGVFAAPTAGERLGRPLHLERHRIRSGPQRIVVDVTGEPASAGIDPRALLIDTHDADNVLPIGDER